MEEADLKCDDLPTNDDRQRYQSLEDRRQTLDGVRLRLQSDLSNGRLNAIEAIQAGILIANLAMETSRLANESASLKLKFSSSDEAKSFLGFSCAMRTRADGKFVPLIHAVFSNPPAVQTATDLSLQADGRTRRVIWQSHRNFYLQVETDGDFALTENRPQRRDILCVKSRDLKNLDEQTLYRLSDPVALSRQGRCQVTRDHLKERRHDTSEIQFTARSADDAKVFSENKRAESFDLSAQVLSSHGLIKLVLQKADAATFVTAAPLAVVSAANTVKFLSVSYARPREESITVSCAL
jgi:hypothetical protein